MANEITTTQLSGVIGDFVRLRALKALYARAVTVKRLLNVSADVKKRFDRVSIPIMPSLSTNAVGTGGSVTNQQVSLSAQEVVVDDWREITVDIDDQANIQSGVANLEEAFADEFGRRMGQYVDLTVLAEHSNITTNTAVGDSANPDPLNDAMLRKAKLTLDRLDVDEDMRTFFLHWDAHNQLLALPRFTEAQETGFARGVQVSDGMVKGAYGIPVIPSSQVAESTSKRNLLVQRDCLGVAIQKNFKVERLARVQKSTPISGDILWGVDVVRNNHGVVIHSAPEP